VDARVIHVSDAYDAMTTDRPYRKGLTHERAIQILRLNSGTQYDPLIVELFAKLPREMVNGQRALAEEMTIVAGDEVEAMSMSAQQRGAAHAMDG
jgi:HD-GYP domain-containing protein (c-di-GMP phosphodiesterase class II)